MATSVIVAVVGVFVAASSRILAEEFKAWNPHLTKKLVSLAVRRLPEVQRERYSEEWSSYVEEIPGEIGKVLAALGLLWAAVGIRRISRGEARPGTPANEVNDGKRQRALRVWLSNLLEPLKGIEPTLFWIAIASHVFSFAWFGSRILTEKLSLLEVRQHLGFPLLLSLVMIAALSIFRAWTVKRKRRAEAAQFAETIAKLSNAEKLISQTAADFRSIISERNGEAIGHVAGKSRGVSD